MNDHRQPKALRSDLQRNTRRPAPKKLQPELSSEGFLKWAEELCIISTSDRRQTDKLVEEFKNTNRGEMKSIWLFLSRHVQTRENAEKIHGNLQFNRQQSSAKVKVSSEPMSTGFEETLAATVTSCESRLNFIECKLNFLKKECATQVNANLRAVNEKKQKQEILENIQRKHFILDTYHNVLKEKIAKYNLHCKKLANSSSEFGIHSEQHASLLTSTTINSFTDSFAMQTEQPCLKQVETACEHFESYLHKVLIEKDCGNQNEFLVSQKKFISMVEELSANPGRIVIQAIADMVLNAVNSIKAMTKNVNIEDDTEQLRFSYNSGELEDQFEPPTVLHVVTEVLQDRQMKLQKRYMEMLNMENKTKKLKHACRELKATITLHLDEMYGKEKKTLGLLNEYVKYQIEMVVLQSSLDVLYRKKKEMNTVLQRRLEMYQVTETKLTQIRSFEKIKLKKHELTQWLIHQNNVSLLRITNMQQQIKSFISTSMLNRRDQFVNFQLENRMMDNEMLCQTLPVQKANSMDDHSLTWLTSVEESSIQEDENLQCLYVLPFKSAEGILMFLLEKKQNALRNNSYYRQALKNHGEDSENMLDVNELVNKLHEHDHQIVKDQLPLFQQTLDFVNQQLRSSEQLDQYLDDWIKHPAFNLPTSYKVAGQSLEQWKHKWTPLSKVVELDS